MLSWEVLLVSIPDKVAIKFLLLWMAGLGHYTLKLSCCHCYIMKWKSLWITVSYVPCNKWVPLSDLQKRCLHSSTELLGVSKWFRKSVWRIFTYVKENCWVLHYLLSTIIEICGMILEGSRFIVPFYSHNLIMSCFEIKIVKNLDFSYPINYVFRLKNCHPNLFIPSMIL